MGHLLLGRAASKSISFVFLVVFVRLLSPAELAVLPMYQAAAAAGIILFAFGIPVTLMREIPRLRATDPVAMQSLLFTGFTMVTTGILVTALLAWLFREPIQALFLRNIGSDTTYLLIVLGMIAGGWSDLMGFVIKSLQEYRSLAFYNATYELLPKCLGLPGYYLGGIDGLLTGFFIGGLLCNLGYTLRFREFIFGIRRFHPVRGLLAQSWPFYLERYLFYFRSYGDVLIISSLLDPVSLAAFYVAKRLYQLLILLSRSIQDVILPSISELLGKGIEAATRGYARAALLVPVALIPVGTLSAALSYAFLDITGGKIYAATATVTTALFCMVAVLDCVVGVQTRALLVLGKNTDRLKTTVFQFAVYFPLLYLFIYLGGIAGAPVAQGIAFMLTSVYAKHLIRRLTSYMPEGYLTWKVFIASTIGALALAGLQYYHYSFALLPVYLFLSTLLVLAVLWALHTEDDFHRFHAALPRGLKKYAERYRARSQHCEADKAP